MSAAKRARAEERCLFLEWLPAEMKWAILDWLPRRDRTSAAATCKDLCELRATMEPRFGVWWRAIKASRAFFSNPDVVAAFGDPGMGTSLAATTADFVSRRCTWMVESSRDRARSAIRQILVDEVDRSGATPPVCGRCCKPRMRLAKGGSICLGCGEFGFCVKCKVFESWPPARAYVVCGSCDVRVCANCAGSKLHGWTLTSFVCCDCLILRSGVQTTAAPSGEGGLFDVAKSV